MKKLLKNILVVVVFASMMGCETFEPIDENRLDFDYIKNVPELAEGILLNGYTGLVNQYSFSEAATDDAVNNQLTNGYKRIALGELNAQYNPAANWDNYQQVFWVNQFLQIVDAGEIAWAREPEVNQLFNDRMKGEALALRALHHFYVLQAHAGKGASGQLLGVPYYTEFIESNGNFNVPRLSFEATVEAIMKDFDDALVLLPTDYTNNVGSIDAKYAGIDINAYQRVNGAQYNLRISGRIVTALKARLALFAASPSFLNDSGYYSLAANNAADVLNTIGGVAGLSPNGGDFYSTDANVLDSESLWRGSIGGNSSTYEARMFPPSLNGKGEINPTHNFVMAFPMKDGTPVSQSGIYDPQNPYANRDPRLEKYVIVNGSSYGGDVIRTGLGGGINRLDSIPEFSTTTGYYLKKLLQPDVKINSDGTTSGKRHANVYFRYTELFLILAEAANEIGGPDNAIKGISARDVIAAIRKRAGINQPDSYLASITSKEAMRELIRNERRIELSFEGHRFWDLRRWGVSLNEKAKGYFFNGSSYIDLPSVEDRNYQSFATYMPIPNSETVKFSALEQNNGW